MATEKALLVGNEARNQNYCSFDEQNADPDPVHQNDENPEVVICDGAPACPPPPPLPRPPPPDKNDHFITWSVFYMFCILSGQFINVDFTKTLKIVVSVAGLAFFGLQFLLYLGHVVTAVGVEVSRIGNISMIEVNNSTTNCSMTSCPIGGTIIYGLTNCTTVCTTDCSYRCDMNCTLPDEHWKFSTAIAIGSIASFLSFSLLTCLILIPLNRAWRDKNLRNTTRRFFESCCGNFLCKKTNYVLSPFHDTFKLQKIEMTCFYMKYAFVHFLFICCFVFSVCYVTEISRATTLNELHQTVPLNNLNKTCWNNIFNMTRISLHLVSLFCSIQSCFIFSKVVYKVTYLTNELSNNITDWLDFHQCQNTRDRRILDERMKRLLRSIYNKEVKKGLIVDEGLKRLLESNNKEEVNEGRYICLQKLDQHFIDDVEPTLNLFGIWFIVHWVSYALTTMLLTGYILQILMHAAAGHPLASKKDLLPNTCTDNLKITLVYASYIVSFTLVHAYLFLYPCFRASAIAVARAKLIHDVSTKRWENVSSSLQIKFVQYLTAQNFAFRVPLFCATIPFGFNWVYVSFFVAICGMYLRMQ